MVKAKAISFDVGNTLLKAKPAVEVIYYNILKKHGCEKDEAQVRKIFFESLDEYERKIFKEDLDLRTDDGEEEEWWRRVDETIAGRCGAKSDLGEICNELWEEFKKAESWEPFHEVSEVLDGLKQEGYTLGVTTNWHTKLGKILEAHGISRFLDFSVISTEVGYKKPSVKIFERTLEKAGCEKAELVHVGDHLDTDYQGARQAGLRAVLIDRDKKSKVKGPVISSLDQLHGVLAGEGAGIEKLF